MVKSVDSGVGKILDETTRRAGDTGAGAATTKNLSTPKEEDAVKISSTRETSATEVKSSKGGSGEVAQVENDVAARILATDIAAKIIDNPPQAKAAQEPNPSIIKDLITGS